MKKAHVIFFLGKFRKRSWRKISSRKRFTSDILTSCSLPIYKKMLLRNSWWNLPYISGSNYSKILGDNTKFFSWFQLCLSSKLLGYSSNNILQALNSKIPVGSLIKIPTRNQRTILKAFKSNILEKILLLTAHGRVTEEIFWEMIRISIEMSGRLTLRQHVNYSGIFLE